MREALTSRSEYGGADNLDAGSSHVANMLRDHVPAEQGEYLSEGSIDTTGTTPASRTH